MTGPGGSGNNLCDYECGSDQGCDGLAPGTITCSDNCEILITEEICNNKDDDTDGKKDEGCDDDKDTFWDSDMVCEGSYLAGNGAVYQCRPEWSDCRDNESRIEHNCADLNTDDEVNLLDLMMLTSEFGKTSGFDEIIDVIPNGEIDIFDLVFIASKFT